MGCHFLLQGIFPTQELNPSLPHCRWSLYLLSYKESPGNEPELGLPDGHTGDIRGQVSVWGLPVPCGVLAVPLVPAHWKRPCPE